MNNIVWKDIPNLYGYEANNLGEIRNKKSKHILKPMINSRGYYQISIYDRNIKKVKTFKVHRLIANTFLGIKNKLDVNHKDGNKLNNDICNIEWCTRQENIIHSWKNNLSKPHDTRKKNKEVKNK